MGIFRRTRHPRVSQSQGGRVLFGLESQIRDAGVFVGVFGGSSCGHNRRGGGRFSRKRSQGQPKWRSREHHVRRVRRQVRVQVMVRVGYRAVQLQLRLDLKGEGRHVAMTILRTHARGEEGRNTLTYRKACFMLDYVKPMHCYNEQKYQTFYQEC